MPLELSPGHLTAIVAKVWAKVLGNGASTRSERPVSRVGDRGELAAYIGERRRRQEARLDLAQVAGAVEAEEALVARCQLIAVVGSRFSLPSKPLAA